MLFAAYVVSVLVAGLIGWRIHDRIVARRQIEARMGQWRSVTG